MTFLIQQTLICAIPLLIVALAGVFAERSGVINIALDGIMIILRRSVSRVSVAKGWRDCRSRSMGVFVGDAVGGSYRRRVFAAFRRIGY